MTNPLPPNRTQIPNIVDDLGLSPYERALYVHYKRVCGENQGAYCYETVKTTAHKTRMSMGQVSEARRTLAERGLILIQEGRPVIVTIANIWELNTAFYQLEHRPNIDDWTIGQIKEWLSDVHTVNVDSHNDSKLSTRSETNLTEDNKQVTDVHTVNVDSYSEQETIKRDNMSSYIHVVKQRIESLNPIESDRQLNPSSNEEGDKSPQPINQSENEKPEKPIPKTEYTPFLRGFLAYFNAKRFKNPTQYNTICNLTKTYGETELNNLAEWAANKGMGLGQAIPAIKSALTNKGKNGVYQNGHNQRSDRPLQRAGTEIQGEPTYDPYTHEFVYPDGRRERAT